MVDEKDTVYINDIESNEIKMYDIAGKFITRCGNKSVNGIPLNHPHSSEFGADANLYITHQNNRRILVFSNNGAIINSWGDDPDNGIRLSHPHGTLGFG